MMAEYTRTQMLDDFQATLNKYAETYLSDRLEKKVLAKVDEYMKQRSELESALQKFLESLAAISAALRKS